MRHFCRSIVHQLNYFAVDLLRDVLDLRMRGTN